MAPERPGPTQGTRLSERWFVIETIGGKERIARDAIAAKKRTTFYPRAEKTVLHARRKETLEKPLYPTYLFVRFDPFDLSWGEILHLPGVWTIVGIFRPRGRPKSLCDVTGANWRPYWGQPRAVPDGVVERIKLALDQDEDGYILREPVATEGAPLARHTRVRVTIADVELTGLVDFHEGTRVRVLLDIMGAATPLIVERDSVAPIEGAP